ncbi:MAG: amidohydrolase family protein [Pseudomonadota bacterium]
MSTTFTLTHLRIWDGIADDYRGDADAIRVENGQITRIGDSATLSQGQADVRDMSGLTAIPGLIDAHVHLCLDPEIKSAEDQAEESPESLYAAMQKRAEAMVKAGITTARDLGGGQWLELKLRDAINQGEFTGPRLWCAGQPITSPRGHCYFWGGEAASLGDAYTVMQRQIEHDVDLIKVMASGGNLTPNSAPVDSQFDLPTLTAIVQAAENHGYMVAAHCHGTDSICNAGAAGVRTIEHCSWVGQEGWGMDYNPEAAALIAEKGIWVSPTINAGWQRYIGSKRFEPRVKDIYHEMRAAGVKLIASTDAGIPNVLHHELAKALPMFAHFASLSPVETLRAATSDCAFAIGLGDVTGALNPELSADLLLLDGDPLTDLACLTQPASVIARGHVVV